MLMIRKREAFPSRTGKDAGPQISNPLEGFFSSKHLPSPVGIVVTGTPFPPALVDANWSLNTPGRDRPRRRTPTPAAEGPDMSARVLLSVVTEANYANIVVSSLPKPHLNVNSLEQPPNAKHKDSQETYHVPESH
jgi:epoxyqueuosine reductase QueG